MVVYEWVPGYNSPTPGGGVGTLTLDSAAILDPYDFNGIPASALVSFSYRWQNGQSLDSTGPYALSVAGPGWSAADGFLTTVFTIQKPGFSLAGQPHDDQLFPGFGESSNNVAFPAEIDAGFWRAQAPAVVPLPAGLWLLLSGLAGLLGAARLSGRAPAIYTSRP